MSKRAWEPGTPGPERIGPLLLCAVAISVFCACEETPTIRVVVPVQGEFVTGTTLQVSGTTTDVPATAQVLVNGEVANRPTLGSWNATIPLDLAAVHNRVVVQLVMPGNGRTIVRNVVAVDGVGSVAVADGDLIGQGIGFRVENAGLNQIEPIISDAVDRSLDIADIVAAENPIVDDECVLNLGGSCVYRATATALFVGATGSTLNADATGPNELHIDMSIEGLFAEIDLQIADVAGSGLETCGLELSIDDAAASADLDLAPQADDPRFVDVNLIGEPAVLLNGYRATFVSGLCSLPIIGDIIDLFLRDRLRELTEHAFLTTLGDPDGVGPLDSPIADGIETALLGATLAGPIGNSIGAVLDAPFSAIEEDANGVTFLADAGITQPGPDESAPVLLASYALTTGGPPMLGGASPGGEPYDLAYGISLSSLNQLLKAYVEGGLLSFDIDQFDVPGIGTVPLTVGIVASLIPEFASVAPPETPVVVNIRSALAPAFNGLPGPNGSMATLRLGGITVEFRVLDGLSYQRPLQLDVSFGAEVDFTPTADGLAFDLAAVDPGTLDALIITNRLGASDQALLDVLADLLPYFEAPLEDALRAFPIPVLLGLELTPTEVALVDSWVVLYGSLAPVPTSQIANVIVQEDLSDPEFRDNGLFTRSEWRRRVSHSATSRTIDVALRGFAGAEGAVDETATAIAKYVVDFDVISVPGEAWRLDLGHSIKGAFELRNSDSGDGAGFTEFRQDGVVSASYVTSTGQSGSFDFVPTPTVVQHVLRQSAAPTTEEFGGSAVAVVTGTEDARVTIDVEFEVRARSDATFLIAPGDKVGIRFGKPDTLDHGYDLGEYPGEGDRSIAQDGHKLSVYLTGLPVGSTCGDGVLDAAEECDDGNVVDGDGCDSDCTIEPSCGDGQLDPSEECDDGNNVDGDGCAGDCTIEAGGPFCGDGQLDPGEECDDGNNVDGDGCNANCLLETGSVCGDGVVEPPESCEPPDTDTCDNNCMARIALCGDGFVTPPELCDDGVNDGGEDQCLACTGVQTCGDGSVTGTEVCEVGTSIDCTELGGGFSGGTASCEPDCTGWDAGSCDSPDPGTCMVLYDLAATFQVTDTPFGLGDTVKTNLPGLLVLEFSADGNGNIVDGPVGILHYWVFSDFVVSGFVTVVTRVHGFAPECNGESAPTWRASTDPGFPDTCEYAGNTTAVGSGVLDQGSGVINWNECNLPSEYWGTDATGDTSYREASISSGPGCLSGFVSAGNIECGGSACSAGGLQAGNNPQFFNWVQPLVNGPAGSGTNSLGISSDFRTVTTPDGAPGGFQSFNVPNEAQSRTWVRWVGTRNDASVTTTCN